MRVLDLACAAAIFAANVLADKTTTTELVTKSKTITETVVEFDTSTKTVVQKVTPTASTTGNAFQQE